jgi:hypothetical protein
MSYKSRGRLGFGYRVNGRFRIAYVPSILQDGWRKFVRLRLDISKHIRF